MKEKNRKLLESFYQLVATFGYNNFGIEKLAQITDIEEETIYNEYENKEQLLLEVIDYIHLNERALIFKFDYNLDLKKQLIEKGKMFIKLNRVDKHYVSFKNQVLITALTNSKIKEKFEQLIGQYIECFSDLIIKLKKIENPEKNNEVKLLATEIFMMLDSLILFENYKKDLEAENVWSDFITRVL